MTKQNPSTEKTSIGYERGGHETAELHSETCLAKHLVSPEGVETYMVRFFNDGPNAGSAYDFNSAMQAYNPSRARQRGEELYPFKKVSERSFQAYLRYLKTENQAHLNVANREVNL